MQLVMPHVFFCFGCYSFWFLFLLVAKAASLNTSVVGPLVHVYGCVLFQYVLDVFLVLFRARRLCAA